MTDEPAGVTEHRPKPRRRHGKGSVERLPSGRWRAVFRRSGVKYASEPKELKAEALAWITSQQEQLGPVLRGHAPSTRLKDLQGNYLEEIRRRGHTEDTISRHGQHLSAVLERWGHLRLGEIDSPCLQRILTEMHRLEWAPATVRNRIDRITSLVRFAQEVGLVGYRPLKIRRPKLTAVSQTATYNADEKKALIKAAEKREDPWYLIFLLLGLRAGLRRGEIWRFRRSDLDDARRLLTVPVRSAVDRPKSGKARTLPVPLSLVAAVKASPAEGDELVIRRPDCRSRWAMYQRLEGLWDGAGVETGGQWLHMLRHTWATDLTLLGVPVPVIMSWAGWTTVPVYLRYVHVDNAAPEAAIVRRLDRL